MGVSSDISFSLLFELLITSWHIAASYSAAICEIVMLRYPGDSRMSRHLVPLVWPVRPSAIADVSEPFERASLLRTDCLEPETGRRNEDWRFVRH